MFSWKEVTSRPQPAQETFSQSLKTFNNERHPLKAILNYFELKSPTKTISLNISLSYVVFIFHSARLTSQKSTIIASVDTILFSHPLIPLGISIMLLCTVQHMGSYLTRSILEEQHACQILLTRTDCIYSSVFPWFCHVSRLQFWFLCCLLSKKWKAIQTKHCVLYFEMLPDSLRHSCVWLNFSQKITFCLLFTWQSGDPEPFWKLPYCS